MKRLGGKKSRYLSEKNTVQEKSNADGIHTLCGITYIYDSIFNMQNKPVRKCQPYFSDSDKRLREDQVHAQSHCLCVLQGQKKQWKSLKWKKAGYWMFFLEPSSKMPASSAHLCSTLPSCASQTADSDASNSGPGKCKWTLVPGEAIDYGPAGTKLFCIYLQTRFRFLAVCMCVFSECSIEPGFTFYWLPR